MIEQKTSIRKSFFKKIFVKICRIFGYEIIDQSNFYVPTQKKALDENLSIQGEKSINLPLCLWDERLSTVGAFNLSSQLNVNISKRKKNIDKNAAAFILQGALDYLNN